MSRTVAKTVVVLLIVAGFASITRAQDDEKVIKPNTKAGSAAWVFSIGGLGTFGLGGINIENNFPAWGVMGAGWKYYLSDDMALRVLLGFANKTEGADTLSAGHTSSLAFGIAAGIEMHTRQVYSTSPYFGAQVSFGTGSTDNTHKSGTETKNSGSSFGLGVLAGFDWYFTHGIAIGGEYMLGFSTGSGSTVVTPNGGSATTISDPSTTLIAISSAANVHLVVHF